MKRFNVSDLIGGLMLFVLTASLVVGLFDVQENIARYLVASAERVVNE